MSLMIVYTEAWRIGPCFFLLWPLASCFPELEELNTDRSVLITSYTFPIFYCSVASVWLALIHVMFSDNVSAC